jgi:hypothetical protein
LIQDVKKNQFVNSFQKLRKRALEPLGGKSRERERERERERRVLFLSSEGRKTTRTDCFAAFFAGVNSTPLLFFLRTLFFFFFFFSFLFLFCNHCMLLSSCQGLLLFLLLHSISSFDIGAKCETLSKASKQAKQV